VRRKTFSNKPADAFQIGDYQRSVDEDEVWIAQMNGIIVGVVSIYSSDRFIHNLFVHPHYQRQSIGTQLLAVAEANLARPMTLKVSMHNMPACAFYEKHAWYQASVHQDDKEPYILYQKD
jgi:ribosomal protein S18 acetylase RimI-like enzyme